MSTNDLVAQIAELRQRVEQLEARPPRRAESLTPTYQTIDPATGQIGALFSGGLDIPTTTVDPNVDEPNPGQAVRYVRVVDGSIRAFLRVGSDFQPGGVPILDLTSQGGAAEPHTAQLRAVELPLGTSEDIYFQLRRNQTSPQTDPTSNNQLLAACGFMGVRILIDDTGRSHFAQMPERVVGGGVGELSPARRFVMTSGAGTITWNGSAISNSLVVTHGMQTRWLGATAPNRVLVTWGVGGTAGGIIVFHVTALSTTTFTVAAASTVGNAAGTTTPIYWLAIYDAD